MVVYMTTYAFLYEAKTLIHRVILQTPDCSICQKRSGHRHTQRRTLEEPCICKPRGEPQKGPAGPAQANRAVSACLD